MSVSRHLIMSRAEPVDKSVKHNKADGAATEYEKLETDIKIFYSKNEAGTAEEESAVAVATSGSATSGGGTSAHCVLDSSKESVCVLLHGALKVENMAALVLLNDDWYGFIYSYADSKKKSNLMLTVLPPGGIFFSFLALRRNSELNCRS